MILNVFVYGTLKPKEANYEAYCQGKVISAIKAYTWGEIYHLKRLGYPAMTQGNNKVHGYLLTLKDINTLNHLDHLEDYQEQRNPSENEYNRQLIQVYNLLTHESLGQAWVYLMELSKIKLYQGEYLSSGEWFLPLGE